MTKPMALLLICCFGLCSSGVETPENYKGWVFPERVRFGMSSNEVFSLRTKISKDFPMASLDRTNVVTFVETQPGIDPLVGYFYYFFDGELHAVAKTFGHRGQESGKSVCKTVHELFERELNRLANEKVLRLERGATHPVSKTVELWHDKQSGNHVFFDEDAMSLRVIVFDPIVFSRKDFFVNEETYRAKMVPAIENMRNTVERQKRHAEEIKRLSEKSPNIEKRER